MSLRRLAGRLRRHDWVAAGIELAIVVVGILIALYLSDLNQARLDRARADDNYRRLSAELASDADAITATRAFWRQVADYGTAAMRHLESGERVDDSNWKTVLAYYQASQMMPLELADTTFLEMRESGALSLMDEGLRKGLADYYRVTGIGMRANILRHDPVYRVQVRGLTPWLVQRYIWDKCYRQLAGTLQELIDCPSPISDVAAARILDGYAKEPSLLANLRYWVATLRVSQNVVRETQRTQAALSRDIEAERQP